MLGAGGGGHGESGASWAPGWVLGTRTPPRPSQNHRKEESREVPRDGGQGAGCCWGCWVLGWGAREGEGGVRRGWGAPGPFFWGVPGPAGVGVAALGAASLGASPWHPAVGIKSPGASGDLCAPSSGVPPCAAFAQPCRQPPASQSRLLATPALVKLGLASWSHWVRALPRSVREQPPGLHQDPRDTKAELGTPSPDVTRHGDPEFLNSEHPAPNPLQSLA